MKTFFVFCFGEHLPPVSLVLGLGLEHSFPWPRVGLSSEGLSLVLASEFFCVLGLEPCVLNSTSGNYIFIHQVTLARRQQRDLSVSASSRHLLLICLPHTVLEASHCSLLLLNVKQRNSEYQFYSSWFDMAAS